MENMEDEELTQSPELQDARPGLFWINDTVIDHFARIIGPDAFAAYSYLARKADKLGGSFPSVTVMGESFGKGRMWAVRQIRVLVEAGLIEREPRYRSDGGQTSSRYILTPLPVLLNLRGSIESDRGGAIRNEPRRNTQEGRNKKVSKDTQESETNEVREVFDHWVSASGKSRAQFSPRASYIRARLKTFTVEQLKTAIDAAHRNPWFLGENERNTYYGDLDTIFRNDLKVEHQLEWAEKNPPQAGANSFDKLPPAMQQWYLQHPELAEQQGIKLPSR